MFYRSFENIYINIGSYLLNIYIYIQQLYSPVYTYSTYIYNYLYKDKIYKKYIKNGNECNETDKYDFILITVNNKNKLIYDNTNNILNLDLDKCNYEFMLVELDDNITNKKYVLHLDGYYLVDNSLFKLDFIKYIMYNQYNIKNYNNQYTISILDNNVDKIMITNHQYIYLDKETYKLKDLKKIDI